MKAAVTEQLDRSAKKSSRMKLIDFIRLFQAEDLL